jgi:hypothetical protein
MLQPRLSRVLYTKASPKHGSLALYVELLALFSIVMFYQSFLNKEQKNRFRKMFWSERTGMGVKKE